MAAFFEKLRTRSQKSGSLLCIGLNPDSKRLPAILDGGSPAERVSAFCEAIIAETESYCAAYSLSLPVFESLGGKGYEALERIRFSIPEDIPVIADGNRGEPGPAAALTARGLFGQWAFDAATVNPFFGEDAVEPWLEYDEKAIYLTCLSSNPGAADLQIPAKLPERIAKMAHNLDPNNERIGLVVGSGHLARMGDVRRIASDREFLVPELGNQGGELEKTVKSGHGKHRTALLITVSRPILSAGQGEHFAQQAGHAAELWGRLIAGKLNGEKSLGRLSGL